MNRLKTHMILPVEERKRVSFEFDGKKLEAFEGEVISSALIASGVRIFSRHHKDGSPQGIFCANGQCAQCTLIADGIAVKSCVTPVREGMKVKSLRGLPEVAAKDAPLEFGGAEELETDALIIGGGPAGLTAALELGALGASVVLVDDKHRLGGKLVLQTHKFFGSVADCYAGTRGIDIGKKLEHELAGQKSVKVWLNSFAVAVFSDKKVGIVRDGKYCLVKPRALLVAAGAREKSLPFPGNTLPGVYGAGAFQTLVNRDLVAPSKRLFILGGGNVGLIAGYHALQAGIQVIGLAEALKEVGGYKVHADKLKRLGVPIYTSHTVLRAEGGETLESVTIAEVDDKFKPRPGTEKTFKADTLLVAVGLNPCDELYAQAKEFGMAVFAAGDAEEIAEASAAMFSGKIAGRDMAEALGLSGAPAPKDWTEKLAVLKSKPGKTVKRARPMVGGGIFPVFHCRQEIPCNPCVSVCPKKSISLERADILSLPVFKGECIGCFKCVAICPGLAVTVADFRKDPEMPTVTFAYEIDRQSLKKGDKVRVADAEGAELGMAEIADLRDMKGNDNTLLVSVRAEKEIALKIAGIIITKWEEPAPGADKITAGSDDKTIVCRCERVSLGTIRAAIRSGIRDINELKAVTRACMGSCGGKTCRPQILSAFRAEGVKPEEITDGTRRPLEMEVFLGQFCNSSKNTGGKNSEGGY